MRIVLASRSPRRLDLLERIGIFPEVVPANIDEAQRANESATHYVQRLSQEKVQKIADELGVTSDVVFLGADTCVELDGVVHDQPQDREAARRTLSILSGRTHQVHTAVTCLSQKGSTTIIDTARVTMVPISTHLMEWYLDTGESYGKAGAYGMQGFGGVLVERVQGSMSTVIGLPLAPTAHLLRVLGAVCPDLRDIPRREP
ncbi:MAG: Maf family protein [bacterium]